ncbi:MAG: hypothetical protein HQL02_04520 [Nitrospirae bacterium]|nr:hypothetical protein [Nitrospirota bacterium]
MKFDNLHSDIDCNCITKEVKENTVDIFLYKLYKNDMTIEEFQSYWEKGQKRRHNPCERICMLKGISVEKAINNDIEIEILSKFKETEEIKPKEKEKYKYYCSLRFRKDAGMVWKTGEGKYHHTFFKCDDFNVELLEIIEVKPLENNV